MKKLIAFVFTMLLFFGCTQYKQKGLTIVAFNQPLASVAQSIVGNKTHVYVLVETDPHTFQLTYKKAELLEHADLYIGVSKQLESFPVKGRAIYMEDLAQNKIKQGNLINLHYWMDPLLMNKLALKLKDELINIDKENADYYENNYKAWEKRANATEEYIKKLFLNIKKHKYIITHPSTAYFNKDFGLKSYPIFVEGTTSSTRLNTIINMFEKGEVKLIVRENQFPEQNIKFLLNELNKRGIKYKLAVIDVLGLEQKDYLKMIESDAERIAKNID